MVGVKQLHWQQFYFICNTKALFWYENKESYEEYLPPKGTLNFIDNMILLTPDSIHNENYVFSLKLPNYRENAYVFACESNVILKQWISKLKIICNQSMKVDQPEKKQEINAKKIISNNNNVHDEQNDDYKEVDEELVKTKTPSSTSILSTTNNIDNKSYHTPTRIKESSSYRLRNSSSSYKSRKNSNKSIFTKETVEKVEKIRSQMSKKIIDKDGFIKPNKPYSSPGYKSPYYNPTNNSYTPSPLKKALFSPSYKFSLSPKSDINYNSYSTDHSDLDNSLTYISTKRIAKKKHHKKGLPPHIEVQKNIF